jgi:hypothetical protein
MKTSFDGSSSWGHEISVQESFVRRDAIVATAAGTSRLQELTKG